MNFNDCKLIIILAEEENITTAAERLYITQPALTYRLKNIENELGAKLFERTSKGIFLTPAGKISLLYANQMLQDLENIKQKIATVSGKRYFALKIAVSPAYMKYKLPTFISEFVKNNKGIDIFVESHKSTKCLDLLREKKVHLAIIRGNHVWSGGSIFLGNDNICLVSKEKISLKDLAELPYINYMTDIGLSHAIHEWWQEYYNIPPHTIIHINDSDSCRHFVSQGLGYSILPHTQRINKNYMNLQVKPLYHKDGTLLVRPSWIMFYKSLLHNPAIKGFLDAFSEFQKNNGNI